MPPPGERDSYGRLRTYSEHRRSRSLPLRRPGRNLAEGQPGRPDDRALRRDLRLGLRPDPGRSQQRQHRLSHGPRPLQIHATAGKSWRGHRTRKTCTATTTACGSIPTDSNYLINVNDGGANVSYDGGKTWRDFHKGIPAIQFYNVALDMNKPFTVYGSVQDFGTYRGLGLAPPGALRPRAGGRRGAVRPLGNGSRGRRIATSPSIRPIPTPNIASALLRPRREIGIQGRRLDEQGNLSQGAPKASPNTAASGWRRPRSLRTIPTSSITASSISSAR